MIEKSEASNGHVHEHQIEPEISAFVAFLTYGNYLLMIVVSYLIKVYFCVLQARYKQGRKMVYKGSWLYTLHTHTLTLRHTHIHPKRHNQIGHIRDFFASLFGISRYKNSRIQRKGYASLFKSQESFFTRRFDTHYIHYIHYTHYINYIHYKHYTHYIH